MTDREGNTNAARVEECEVRSSRTSGYSPLEKDRGTSWLSVILGWLAALGAGLILSGIVGATVGAILGAGGASSSATEGGTAGLIGLLITLLLAFIIGGYVAGRLGRRSAEPGHDTHRRGHPRLADAVHRWSNRRRPGCQDWPPASVVRTLAGPRTEKL